MRVSLIPAPLRRPAFRWLWVGMSTSYAGDSLQGLAQAWLVATLTGSALAVGGITAAGSLPLLFSPLGGVIADQVDRRRLLLAGQLAGAVLTAIVAVLVLAGRAALWHIYAWAVLNGMIVLVSRPAYKAALTVSVPPEEVRPAVAINSMTETASLVTTNAAGSLLLGWVGLPIAFLLNTGSYVVAAASLWVLRRHGQPSTASRGALALRQLLPDLVQGVAYLLSQPRLLHPLLLTFATLIATAPTIGLLAAIVHAQAGSIVDLGLLGAATSLGAFAGAAFAGARSAGNNPARSYALLGVGAAAAVALFTYLPLGLASLLPLATIGFILFAQAVWNTSRVRDIADAAYQARLQAVTSMAFTLGFPVGMLWAGAAIDRLGLTALFGGAVALGALSLIIAARQPWGARETAGTN